ncbi:MAG: DUF2079 domain-containing protein, partial [Acidimicrobiia bacterium]|nr:DUF2079 domain-containing protein [Acidimicrobiia bacterium]
MDDGQRHRRLSDEEARSRLVMWVATAIWLVIFTRLAIGLHNRFLTHTFDLGIFDQGLWLMSRFEAPFVTLRGLNLFADHSSYVMVLLVPLYWIWPDIRVLMVFTVFVVAAGAPLTYYLGRALGLRPMLSAAVAVSYLLHPATQWLVWDNFHPEIIALPVMIGMTLAFVRGRPGWGLALGLLALTVKEDAALVVVPLALACGWLSRRWRPALSLAAIGIVVFIVQFAVLLPTLSPTGETAYSSRYARFGGNAFEIVGGVVLDPEDVIEELATGTRLEYLAETLGPAPTALLSPGALAAGGPITLANMLSSHFYQHNIRYHYTAYLLAVIFISAPLGTRWLARRVPEDRHRWLAALIVAAALVGSVLSGPGIVRGVWGRPVDTTVIEETIALIPGDAVITVDTNLATHLSHRAGVYRVPNPWIRLDWSVEGDDESLRDPLIVEWVALRPERISNDEL